jgi:antitoxin ParD1/3/4
MRASLNISLPESMRKWVDQQIDGGGYGTASEYIRELIRDAQTRSLRQQIDANLLDALQSGPATPLTQQDWEDIRKEGKKLAASRNRRKAA